MSQQISHPVFWVLGVTILSACVADLPTASNVNQPFFRRSIPAKVAICHNTGHGTYNLISVSVNAEQEHRRNHGDGAVGDPVPGMEGFAFNQSCVPYGLWLGLIAYYPLDGDARDESGNNHHGDVQGPIAARDRLGNPDGALHFDGLDDYVKVLHDPALYPTSLGMSAWVKLDALPTTIQMLFSSNGTGTSPPYDPYYIS